ncbi:MAG: restriction endonuclease [bacterium]|nr:restriction endonuclease [bacterium]
MSTFEDQSGYPEVFTVIYLCAICGWWGWVDRVFYPDVVDSKYLQTRVAAGSLKELHLTDVRVPLEEVRSYLLARYRSRFSMHPRLFEETVGSVFRDLGYLVEVTGYANDGGIDVILKRSNETVGVQVKRYKNKIEVEQIRSLAGALVLRDYTKGIFVATASFTSGASQTAKDYASKGLSIELYDCVRFLEALKIGQRKRHGSLDGISFRDAEYLLPFEELELRKDLSTVIEESER